MKEPAVIIVGDDRADASVEEVLVDPVTIIGLVGQKLVRHRLRVEHGRQHLDIGGLSGREGKDERRPFPSLEA